MATIKDVAQAAQVSTAAVSRVLNKDDNISVSPEVRARIFQAAHVLGYVSPRQRKAAEHKTHLVIGVADWRIIRPDRHNVRLSSLSCLVQMMTDQYEVTFIRLTFGEPQKVDGIIALGVFSEKEIDFLRSLSFAIVFVNSNQHNYGFDQVQVDFDRAEGTADGDGTGVRRVLEAVRQCGLAETCRIYQASTSELYGKVEEVPQNENTPFHPYSPYAVAKLYGYWIVKEYREAYNMFCCSGILFNHESERRGETFVTRKITLAAARIAQGKQEKLYLGNLSSLRDWGYAKDYVECMWLILQHDRPEDFVIAAGVQHSVREFCHLAIKYAGIELAFQGEGENEKGVCVSGPEHLVGKTLVEVSPDFYRPTDVVNLWGDPTKAKAELGWDPGKTSFEELVRIMVEADMAKVAVERAGDHVRTNLAGDLEEGVGR